MRRLTTGGLVFAGFLSVAVSGRAQTLGTIAGAVKDTSGAVLPGVTVEVASPSLIEKTRTALTDGAGQYTIVNLPVGTYSVTFALQGFNTERHEGIEVLTNFTAKSEEITSDAVVQRIINETPSREGELSRDERFRKILAS